MNELQRDVSISPNVWAPGAAKLTLLKFGCVGVVVGGEGSLAMTSTSDEFAEGFMAG